MVKRVLISQPEPVEIEKSPYTFFESVYGLTIDYRKFIQIEGLSSREFRNQKISILDYTAVIFTSRQAVDHFFNLAKLLRIEVPAEMKYFCISESTAFYLQKYVQYRKRKIFYGQNTFADLLTTIKRFSEDTYLLPCSEVHKKDIPNTLTKAKINFTSACIYRTVADDLSDIEITDYDMLVFFSPSGVKSLFDNYPDFEQGEMLIGGFGTATCKAIEESSLTLNIKAPTKSSPSMSMAMEEYLLKKKLIRKKRK